MTDIRELCEQIIKGGDGGVVTIEQYDQKLFSASGYELAKAHLNLLDTGWVSVEDGLPESGQECFIYNGVNHHGWYDDGNKVGVIGKFYSDATQDTILKVTHWMIPPPPHKEGG